MKEQQLTWESGNLGMTLQNISRSCQAMPFRLTLGWILAATHNEVRMLWQETRRRMGHCSRDTLPVLSSWAGTWGSACLVDHDSDRLCNRSICCSTTRWATWWVAAVIAASPVTRGKLQFPWPSRAWRELLELTTMWFFSIKMGSLVNWLVCITCR